MTVLDWWVIGAYLAGMLVLALALGRRQRSARDYYLAGGDMPPAALATSILATQCSTNSLLGAPAFVGFTAGGGLVWLQYELAVPLAMLGLAILFPAVFRGRSISVYAFLEQRLGRPVRRVASGCFLFFRGVATGVTVYGVASVLSLVTGIGYVPALALLMGVTVAYDVLGGMRAVVISDVLQMLLLIAAVLLALWALSPYLLQHLPELSQRTLPLLNDAGLRGESNFGFWPMLFGGLFLYMAYYGCDQSQAQRLLAARDERSVHRILLLNGVLRFPLVLSYCVLGLGLAAYALSDPEFLSRLPVTAQGQPNLNLVFPAYVLESFAPGLAGLAIVGLFAAAMSSIDSALNALSASTLEDFVPRDAPADEPAGAGARETSSATGTRFALSKIITLVWGLFAIAFSFAVEHIASTVLEAINKVGSMVNGPLLALFLLAALNADLQPRAAIAAFVLGIVANAVTWLALPGVSWLWWNVSGCLVSVVAAGLLQTLGGGRPGWNAQGLGKPPAATALLATFFTLLLLLVLLQWRAGPQ